MAKTTPNGKTTTATGNKKATSTKTVPTATNGGASTPPTTTGNAPAMPTTTQGWLNLLHKEDTMLFEQGELNGAKIDALNENLVNVEKSNQNRYDKIVGFLKQLLGGGPSKAAKWIVAIIAIIATIVAFLWAINSALAPIDVARVTIGTGAIALGLAIIVERYFISSK